MRKLLKLKLLMDQRRIPSILINSQRRAEENTFNKSLLIYGLMGLLFVFIVLAPLPLFLKMNLVLGTLIVMVAVTMVSDYSSVLLDTRDKEILLSKPISPKTVNAAKMTHILINLLTITFAMAGPSLLVGSYKYGFAFFGLYFVDLLLLAGVILVMTSILYFFVLLLFDGDRLMDIINYVQIFLSLALMVGYQFTGRIFRFVSFNLNLDFRWWMYLLPSAWFSAPFSLFLENRAENYYKYLCFLGISVPVLLAFFYFRVAANYFEKGLEKLNRVSLRKGKHVEKRAIISEKLMRLIIPNSCENVFGRFAQHIISSERSIKLRLYPSLGLATFMPMIMLVNTTIGSGAVEPLIPQGTSYFFIYISVLILSQTILTINASENYKGAWVYKALPIEVPGRILLGTLKGFILKYLLPIYLLISLLFALPYGIWLIPHLILIFANMLLLIILLFKLAPKELPFSIKFQNEPGDRFILLIASLAFTGISACLHYKLRNVPLALSVYFVTVCLVTIFLWKSSGKIAWKEIE
ncbi:hypothetical protein REC12_14750 [Desulfosporosinus sp. PR]|nr:hypothetical protein [Desulfosporosinus sp. PR]